MARGDKRKHGFNSVVASLFLVAILVLLNFVSDRHHARTDLTETGMFSLADQTVKVLDGLERGVAVHAFFQNPDEGLQDLLTEYRLSSRNFSFDFIDPDRQPDIAKSFDVTQYGTVVVECGPRVETLRDVTEEKLTNAILKVSRDEKKVVYFLEGHGERDIENIERDGYNAAKQALESENYDVSKTMIAREGAVPADCAVLIVVSPHAGMLGEEINKITSYLEGGGSAFFMLDPSSGAGLEEFLASGGIDLGNNVIVDVSGMGRLYGAGPTIPLVTDYKTHAITRGFSEMTFFPLARSVTPGRQQEEGVELETILSSSPRSWAETEIEKKPLELNEDVDLKGPVSIAVALTKELEQESREDSSGAGDATEVLSKHARMVVIGDADFACNSYLSVSGNRDLFLNVVNWLAEEEDMISIRPMEKTDRRISMTKAQSRNVFYLTVIAIPLLVIAVGMVVWIKRK